MTNKEVIAELKEARGLLSAYQMVCFSTKTLDKAIEVLEKQEKLEAMKNEDEVIEYLSAYSKDTLIDLFLQMRFERDLYMEMYERSDEE